MKQKNAYWLLIPWLVGFVVMIAIPLIALVVLSTLQTDGGISQNQTVWIGADHYRSVLRIDSSYIVQSNDPWYWNLLGGKPNDPKFYQSLYNSLSYTIFAVPLGLLSSLLVALLLNRSFFGQSLIRSLVYMPHLLSGIATIVIWSWLLNPQFGLINQALQWMYVLLDPIVRVFHESGTSKWLTPDWLYSPFWSKPAVILMNTWTMGGAMLIFLAALRRVPSTLYDAADLDGAGIIKKFRHVTWPMITPVVLFNLIVSTIFSMQIFSEAYMLQNRQQQDSLLFYVLNVYHTAFQSPYQLGYASALSLIFILVLVVLILPLIYTSRRWVYEAL